MKDYYDPEMHGPTETVPLDRRYCKLQGSYILCPALIRQEGEWDCRFYPGELDKGRENSLIGLLGTRKPVMTPLRAKACVKDGTYLSLVISRRG